MCDRYSLRTNLDQLADLFAVTGRRSVGATNTVDIAPGQFATVVRLASSGERMMSQLRWGLAPYWPAGGDAAMKKTTAQAETLTQTPAFRVAFRRFRCLVPAGGFYESRTQENGDKQSFLVTLNQETTFAFAGLWDVWIYDDQPLETFSIITVNSGDTAQQRMPAILPSNLYSQWLSPQSQPEELLSSLRTYSSDAMQYQPIADVLRSRSSEIPEVPQPVAA